MWRDGILSKALTAAQDRWQTVLLQGGINNFTMDLTLYFILPAKGKSPAQQAKLPQHFSDQASTLSAKEDIHIYSKPALPL